MTITALQRTSTTNTQVNSLTFNQILDELVTRFILNVPEEELESLDRLFFQIEEAHWFYEDFLRGNNKHLPSLSFKQFVDRMFEHCTFLAPFREAIEKHTQSFYQYKSKVPVYGAILLNQSRDKVLLVKGWNSKSWSFPRGKINQNEQEVACAIREVKEEIGFDITGYINSKNFIKVNFNEQSVKLYIVTDIPENVHFAPQTRREIRAIEWHSISQIMQTKRPGNNQYIFVATFINKLNKWIVKQNGMEQKQSVTKTKTQERKTQNRKRRISNELEQQTTQPNKPEEVKQSEAKPAISTLLTRSTTPQTILEQRYHPQISTSVLLNNLSQQQQLNHQPVYTPSASLYSLLNNNGSSAHNRIWMNGTTVTV
jgi:mRNA-decapping enzyme subunit 2